MDICETGQCQQKSIYTHAEVHSVKANWQQSVNVPAGLDSKYLCEVVIPYNTVSPDREDNKYIIK